MVAARDREHGGEADPWRTLADAQSGVLTRAQAIGLGMTPSAVDARLASGRWLRLHHGVYATFTGPVQTHARLWAALLACGDEAALGGRAALWLWDVVDLPGAVLTVCVPERRRVVDPDGVRVVRHRSLADQVHPAALPRRLRLEQALLDVLDEAPDEAEVIDLVLRVAASRRTTPGRIMDALKGRRRHRHRGLVAEVLDESADGVHSHLERRYRRGVERAPGLPRGERNAPDPVIGRTGARRTRYRDIRYRRWRVVVELDGAEAHPSWLLHRDRSRDNSATLSGERVLTYGWRETATQPCQVAVEVIRMLWSQGWRGTPHPCGPECPVRDLLAPGHTA